MARQKRNTTIDAGVLILRLGFGIMFFFHGFPKIVGGPEEWAKAGTAMKLFGIGFIPVFWGFMSALIELGGGIFLILGLFTRAVAALMLLNMVVALASHLSKEHSLMAAAHPIEDGIVFLALIFIGSGRYALDAWKVRP